MDFAIRFRLPSPKDYGSGRCVQMRMLTSPEYEQIQIEAATAVGADKPPAAHSVERRRRGVLAAITHISEEGIDPKKPLGEVEWKEVTISDLMRPGGPLEFYRLFNAKEMGVIFHQFGELHEPDKKDVDEGNVVSVPRV